MNGQIFIKELKILILKQANVCKEKQIKNKKLNIM